jgi:hypothetical protein
VYQPFRGGTVQSPKIESLGDREGVSFGRLIEEGEILTDGGVAVFSLGSGDLGRRSIQRIELLKGSGASGERGRLVGRNGNGHLHLCNVRLAELKLIVFNNFLVAGLVLDNFKEVAIFRCC